MNSVSLSLAPKMPIYHFKIESHLTSQAAIARLKEMVGPPRFFLGQGYLAGGEAGPPFIGKVEGDSFRVRRDIRYRNAFLPLIWGRITTGPMGTRVSVTMFMHPIMTLFMLVWFSGVGAGVAAAFSDPVYPLLFIPAGLLVFGVALVCGGFFPEAINARRLLEEALSRPASALHRADLD